MFGTFLQMSGFAFWIILAVIVLIDIIALSNDNAVPPSFAVFLSIVGLVCAVLFTDAFAGFTLASFVGLIVAYLAVGVSWSMWNWYDFLVLAKADLRKKYDAEKDAMNGTWLEYAAKNRPFATYNKQRLVNWMALWPFSMSWWVLTWPRRAFVWLYERLSTVFDRISARVFAS